MARRLVLRVLWLERAFASCDVVARVAAVSAEVDAAWSRSQAGAGLLRVTALPRVGWLLRALHPTATEAFATGVDQTTRAAYEKIMTLKLTTLPQQTQAALPVRLGGNGFQLAMTIRVAAWVGSWLATLPLVRELVGPARASREVVAYSSAPWAVALRAAVATLAQQGAYSTST